MHSGGINTWPHASNIDVCIPRSTKFATTRGLMHQCIDYRYVHSGAYGSARQRGSMQLVCGGPNRSLNVARPTSIWQAVGSSGRRTNPHRCRSIPRSSMTGMARSTCDECKNAACRRFSPPRRTARKPRLDVSSPLCVPPNSMPCVAHPLLSRACEMRDTSRFAPRPVTGVASIEARINESSPGGKGQVR